MEDPVDYLSEQLSQWAREGTPEAKNELTNALLSNEYYIGRGGDTSVIRAFKNLATQVIKSGNRDMAHFLWNLYKSRERCLFLFHDVIVEAFMKTKEFPNPMTTLLMELNVLDGFNSLLDELVRVSGTNEQIRYIRAHGGKWLQPSSIPFAIERENLEAFHYILEDPDPPVYTEGVYRFAMSCIRKKKLNGIDMSEYLQLLEVYKSQVT